MEHVLLALDLAGLLLVLAAVAILVRNVRDFWHTPTAEAFVYYAAASLLLALMKVFLHLAEAHTLPIGEATAAIGWHILFYLSMGMFISGTTALIRVGRSDTGSSRSFSRIIVRGVTPVAIGVVAFAVSVLVDPLVDHWFAGSILDRVGLVHFLAFVMSVGVVRAMARLREETGTYLGSIVTPMNWAVLFLGLVHLWELITESWQALPVPEEIIEPVEVLLTLPAFALIFFAFLRTRRRA